MEFVATVVLYYQCFVAKLTNFRVVVAPLSLAIVFTQKKLDERITAVIESSAAIMSFVSSD